MACSRLRPFSFSIDFRAVDINSDDTNQGMIWSWGGITLEGYDIGMGDTGASDDYGMELDGLHSHDGSTALDLFFSMIYDFGMEPIGH
jgi:hypothetical protein